LWLETQNVQPDKTGHYSVQLGAASSQGLPATLFAGGEARWLGVQAQGEAEQPRTLLMSVPYALKALDAETIGGKPASAFMLAPASSNGSASPNSPATDITGSGTANYLPKFTGATTIGNSKIYQNSSNQVGINTTSPAATLDVSGSGDVRDTLTLFPKSTHPTLSVSGTAFQVSSTGKVTFVSGQTFPGTGTVTSVGSGAGLTGGPITGSGTLSIATGGVTNGMLQNSTVGVKTSGPLTGGGTISLGSSETLGLESCSANQILEFVSGAWTCENAPSGTITGVTAGTGLSGGGSSGDVTVSINTSVVPQLGTANNFTGNLSTNGELAAGGAPTGNVASGTIEVDAAATNSGAYGPGLLFGGGGEGIASPRTSNSVNQYGLNFFTNYTVSMAIANTGEIGIPVIPEFDGWQLYIAAQDTPAGTLDAFEAVGYSGASGSGFWGTSGVDTFGGNGDTSTSGTQGGNGINGQGGIGEQYDGDGAYLQGGNYSLYGDGVYALAGSGDAGFFYGDVDVVGTLSKSGGSFKIDHPLDPANKYLYHSFVESPDMMNIYNGNITTDGSGTAVVTMPDWFEVLNRDFRYQLTVIGSFAQAIIAEELTSGHFVIRTDKPNVKVSWQITGIRQDPWANAHRIPVEQEKEANLKGFYLHPELYGAPADKTIALARHPHPKGMREMRVRPQTRPAVNNAARPAVSAAVLPAAKLQH